MQNSLMPVMPAKCKTCPFQPHGDPCVRAKVLGRILEASQLCHHTRLAGKPETHLCRGARDQQLELMYRLQVIPEPTDQAWASTWETMNSEG